MIKKTEWFEPWVFIFFGIFHLHRIWGLIDRKAYADFWLGVMESRGMFYYLLMSVMAILCVCGIVTFLKNLRSNFRWRWIYIFCGGYVLFDLFAIVTGLEFWHKLILKMFDINATYWNILWVFFIVLGAFSFGLGVHLLRSRCGKNIREKIK
ncbi:MAG: hypothetical protein K2K57_01480 [Oscillospiraceae bacterium]|nr:hypothetical protein [Oscillospiraceae bacterium]